MRKVDRGIEATEYGTKQIKPIFNKKKTEYTYFIILFGTDFAEEP